MAAIRLMPVLCVSISAISLKNTMAEYVAKRDRNRCPTRDWRILREDVIPATGKTRSEIAALLGISRQHLYDILNERNRFPDCCLRLGKLFGDGAGVWARMQSAYDTWKCGTRTVRRDQKNPHNQNEGDVKRWSGSRAR
jgi:addiction module HigA family antidote